MNNERIYLVANPGHIFHGRKVKLLGCTGMSIDGKVQYDVKLADGTGAGMLPLESLIPVDNK